MREPLTLTLSRALGPGLVETGTVGQRCGDGVAAPPGIRGPKIEKTCRGGASEGMSGIPSLKLRRAPSLRDGLLPSSGPTPRPPSLGAGFRLHTAVLSVPSAGPANDAARVRNGGSPLLKRGARMRQAASLQCAAKTTGCLGGGLLQVSSAPALLGTEAKTPRAARGMVRKVSKVLIDYPGAGSASSGAGEGRRSTTDRMLSTWPCSKDWAAPNPRRSTIAKRVSFGDEETFWDPTSPTGPLYSSKSREDGTPTPALRQSGKKMDGLFELRRCGKDDAVPSPPAVPSATPLPVATPPATPPAVLAAGGDGQGGADAGRRGSKDAALDPGDDSDEALMYAVLRDLNDKEEQLRAMEAQMVTILKNVNDSGGARHATAVISGRILAVARRKASLLHDVEERTESLRTAHARREEIVPSIVSGKASAPEELGGIRRFLEKYTHGPGHPADENKSHFAKFAQSFKLPKQHEALARLKALADEVGEFWADTCLAEAEKGHGHAVLRRLFDVALGTGVDQDHPKLVRAIRILNDRLAERVLKEAQERQKKDAFQEEMGKMPRVGAASEMGDKIEQDVFAAVKEGVPENDPRLQQAMEICKALRQKDGERKRLEGRQKRLEAQAASAKT